MLVPRILLAIGAGTSLFAAAPASAQFFFKPASLTAEPVNGSEPGMVGPALAGATAAEYRAALVWNMRAALNVAALQCQFTPTLLTLDNYNTLLKDHGPELNKAYDVLEAYFIRAAKNNKRTGQLELDRYGTRVYSGFSTVGGQLSFCQTAASIGLDAKFTPRGDFYKLAEARMRELRASLQPWGEQYRPGNTPPRIAQISFPPFGNNKCWKKERYQPKKCGPLRLS